MELDRTTEQILENSHRSTHHGGWVLWRTKHQGLRWSPHLQHLFPHQYKPLESGCWEGLWLCYLPPP